MTLIKRYRNPYNGRRSAGYRFRFHVRSISHRSLFLPIAMKSVPEIRRLVSGESPLDVFNVQSLGAARNSFNELRKKYDFPFWAATEYRVRDIHDADLTVPLLLNSYQHYIIDTFLRRFSDRLPGRYVISKSFRSCGVTTCVQAYIIWRQMYMWRKNSATYGASMSNLNPLKANMVRNFYDSAAKTEANRILIPSAGYSAFFTSYHSPDALRGIDFGYVHLADMSKFYDPSRYKSERAFSAAYSGMLPDYYTLIVMEGNIPGENLFRLEDNHDIRDPRAMRSEDYYRVCRNPSFLRRVVHASNTDDSYPFIHLNLSTIFLAATSH